MLRRAVRLVRQQADIHPACPTCARMLSTHPARSSPCQNSPAARRRRSTFPEPAPVASTSKLTLDVLARTYASNAFAPAITAIENDVEAEQEHVRAPSEESQEPSADALAPFSRVFPANSMPSIEDLDAHKPKRLVVPHAASPGSVRTLYRKKWDGALKSLVNAFDTRQLRHFVRSPVSDGGLGLSLTDPGLSIGFPPSAKSSKGSKPKKTTIKSMSKRELAMIIMTLHWRMIHPDNVAAPRLSAKAITENVPLSDRDAFLLLSVYQATHRDLTRRLGVEMSLARDLESELPCVVFNGNPEDITTAKAELDRLLKDAVTVDVDLLGPISDVRPEVYQAISTLTRGYLEPGPTDRSLSISTFKEHSLAGVEARLHQAFIVTAARTATPLYEYDAESDTEKRIFPWYPDSPLSFPAVASVFGRYKTVNTFSSAIRSVDEAENDFQQYVKPQGATLRPLFPDQVPMSGGGDGNSTEIVSQLVQSLRHGMPSGPVSLRATFGHVLWPAYDADTSSLTATAEDGSEDVFSIQTLLTSRRQNGGSPSFFASAVPPRFYELTGLRERVAFRQARESPYMSMIGRATPPPFAGDNLQRIEAPSAPTMRSKTVRQIVYRQVDLPDRGSEKGSTKSLVIELSEDATEGFAFERTQKAVEVLVPSGSSDVQFVATHETARQPLTKSMLSALEAKHPWQPLLRRDSAASESASKAAATSSRHSQQRSQGTDSPTGGRVVSILRDWPSTLSSDGETTGTKSPSYYLESDRTIRTLSFEASLSPLFDSLNAPPSSSDGQAGRAEISKDERKGKWRYEVSEGTFSPATTKHRQTVSLELLSGADGEGQAATGASGTEIEDVFRIARLVHDVVPTLHFRP